MITFIVGLLGSGKTTLANSYECTIIDDISIKSIDDFSNIIGDIVITDPNATIVSKITIVEKCQEWFPNHDIEFIAFENDPDQCINNIINRDSRIISESYIRHLSSKYDTSQYSKVIPVYKT